MCDLALCCWDDNYLQGSGARYNDELTYSLVDTIPEHVLYGFIVLQHNGLEYVVQASLQARRGNINYYYRDHTAPSIAHERDYPISHTV